MDAFFEMDTQRAAVQTMESLYILATSKNIETIKGRYEFLLTLIPTLKSAKHNSEYSGLIQSALGQFKTMYPAGIPQDYQLAVLSNPESFDLNEFYCKSLINALKGFYDKQIAEINSLKKESAKTKRVTKIAETFNLFQQELILKCSTSRFFPEAQSEFEKLLSTLG